MNVNNLSQNRFLKILAIDTSCDETSAAVVCGRRVLSNIISSQAKLHKRYGGIMPSLARLEHVKRIDAVIELALLRSNVDIGQIDAIAVTQGPGLAIALEVGLAKAKELATQNSLPLIAVNHMEGHLLSSLAQNAKGVGRKLRPEDLAGSLALLVSGKHSEIVKIEGIGDYQLLGETLDDASGEAFDKAARLLGLGYPGAKALGELAAKSKQKYALVKHGGGAVVEIETKLYGKLKLPLAMYNNGLNMSFSGLKTAFWQLVNSQIGEGSGAKEGEFHLTADLMIALAALFEAAVIETLAHKVELALINSNPKYLLLGGGVVGSAPLRKRLRKLCWQYKCNLVFPAQTKLLTDNAAMIGVAASFKLKAVADLDSLDRKPNWSIFK